MQRRVRHDDHAAQADWAERADTTGVARADGHLVAPSGLTSREGVGHVTLHWEPVEGAIGYEVLRGEDPTALQVLDHGSDDLLAVPHAPYVDTDVDHRTTRHYAVAAFATIEDGSGPRSDTVSATPRPAKAALPQIRADIDAAGSTTPLPRPWWMVGAEHVSQLDYDDPAGAGTTGATIGEEYTTALARMHDEVGVTHVRAHAILDDENEVVSNRAGRLVVDASRIIALYERLAGLGLRPVVELGFMPRALARDPEATVFTYGGIVSPPDQQDEWGLVVRELVTALVDHFGIDEVVQWPFEVWNEPNLAAFWTGSMADYHELYDQAARAVKEVDEGLLVGGPATAAVGWIGSFLDHVVSAGSPLDFLTTHVYGTYPLDLRPALRARDLDGVEVWWTEWGVSPRHFREVNDLPFGAPFVLSGMKAAAEVADALAYWVATDHFEELGRPPAVLHGGFGLQTVGNLRKPRHWALALAHQQGPAGLDLALDGDGAHGLVDGWASRHDDGTVDVLLWNGTLDQSAIHGRADLDREVVVRIAGTSGGNVAIARIDATHSNVTARLERNAEWPQPDEWTTLRDADVLDVEDRGRVEPADGVVEVRLVLPMPGVARVRLAPDAVSR